MTKSRKDCNGRRVKWKQDCKSEACAMAYASESVCVCSCVSVCVCVFLSVGVQSPGFVPVGNREWLCHMFYLYMVVSLHAVTVITTMQIC